MINKFSQLNGGEGGIRTLNACFCVPLYAHSFIINQALRIIGGHKKAYQRIKVGKILGMSAHKLTASAQSQTLRGIRTLIRTVKHPPKPFKSVASRRSIAQKGVKKVPFSSHFKE